MRTPLHLYGKSGSGKERIARLLHLFSFNPHKPWIAVNCGSFSRGTYESALFGHCKGAFTGALHDHRGLIEQADGGSLFLDEIGELPQEMQAHLLRVLQEKELRRLGEERIRKVDFRLISASHRPLEVMVEQGKMREDLYYRLCGITIQLPSLLERPMDIPRLALSIWREREGYDSPFPLSASELSQLHRKNWNGNIRELGNWLYQQAIDRRWDTKGTKRGESSKEGLAQQIYRRQKEDHHLKILAALTENGGNVSATARALGVPRTTLHYRLKQMDEMQRWP